MRRFQAFQLLRAALNSAAQQSASSSSRANALAWTTLQRARLMHIMSNVMLRQVTQQEASFSISQHHRHFSEDLRSASAVGEIPEGYYHQIVDQTLEDLLERLEYFVEELDLDDTDIEYSQGVLTLRLGRLGTYVINKQTPNRQIWMSSPVSGPVRYDWAPGKWVYHRDGHDLHSRLSMELKNLTGEELDLSPCFACGQLNTCAGERCGDAAGL